MSDVFKNGNLRDGDVCSRELRADRYEVSVWKGSLESGSWHDLRIHSLTELNKLVGGCTRLGEASGWTYYRP
jgi:hypothetical protein